MPGQGPGVVLTEIIRQGVASRPALESATGLSRPTISDRVRLLIDAGFVTESTQTRSSRGRPAGVLELRADARVILCVDIGEERARVAVADLKARILVDSVIDVRIAAGPRAVLDAIAETARSLLDAEAVGGAILGGIGVGLPAPVDYATGKTIGWSIMAGWEGYGVRGKLAAEFRVPVVVDNDVNLLVMAEHRLCWAEQSHLFFLKTGTGIGSGLIVDGSVNRGRLGAAGDIGHTHVPGHGDPQCRCGNRGCLEAVAGGWALARELRLRGEPYEQTHDARGVVAAVARGDAPAMQLIRDAGRTLGESVAFATSLLNPAVIVIGGELAKAGDALMAGVREVVYQRSLPLATKHLVISLTRLDETAGVVGAALVVAEQLLRPDRIDEVVRQTVN